MNIHEAKTNLSKYLNSLSSGERIILCKRNVPIAEIRPIEPPPTDSRPIGLAKGEFEVSDSFFEPLPDEILDAFYREK